MINKPYRSAPTFKIRRRPPPTRLFSPHDVKERHTGTEAPYPSPDPIRSLDPGNEGNHIYSVSTFTSTPQLARQKHTSPRENSFLEPLL